MQQPEYQIETFDSPYAAQQWLNHEAREGWRLDRMVSRANGDLVVVLVRDRQGGRLRVGEVNV